MQRKDFNNKFNRVGRSKPEINSGEQRTNSLGYIPRERQIKTLIEAGKRLEILRGQYDFSERDQYDIDDVQPDPTRSKSFDLADASMVMKRVKTAQINRETGESYPTNKPPRISNESNAKAPEGAKDGLDTPSRSVSSPLTPKDKDKQFDPDSLDVNNKGK